MVLKLNARGCSPSCCGEPMKEIIAGTTDAAREKHVPAVTVDGDTVTVQVGSVAHPMMDALQSARILESRYLIRPCDEMK